MPDVHNCTIVDISIHIFTEPFHIHSHHHSHSIFIHDHHSHSIFIHHHHSHSIFIHHHHSHSFTITTAIPCSFIITTAIAYSFTITTNIFLIPTNSSRRRPRGKETLDIHSPFFISHHFHKHHKTFVLITGDWIYLFEIYIIYIRLTDVSYATIVSVIVYSKQCLCKLRAYDSCKLGKNLRPAKFCVLAI